MPLTVKNTLFERCMHFLGGVHPGTLFVYSRTVPFARKKKLDANQSCGRRLIYVQGCHENCDGSTTSGYALRRRVQGRHGGAATRPTIT